MLASVLVCYDISETLSPKRKVVTGLNALSSIFPPVRELSFLISLTSFKIATYSFSERELLVLTVAFL